MSIRLSTSKKKKNSKKPKPYFTIPKGDNLFQARARELNLYDKVPEWVIKKPNIKNPITISGPYNTNENPSYEFTRSYGCTVSTYPYYPNHASREGDPICDSYRIHTYENGVLVCLADGCNWGERPKEASNRAKDAFVAYVQDNICDCRTLKEVSSLLFDSLAVCHNMIVYDKDDIWMAGTTTLLGGLLIETDETSNDVPKWVFLCVSIGDCKAFYYDLESQNTIDLTAGNRKNLSDARDPGGRIGPYVAQGDPDLRNLEIYLSPCRENDIIILVSDGVHDNLDPQTLGMSPTQFGFETEDWTNVEYEKGVDVKIEYMNNFITNLMKKKEDGGEELISPKLLSKKLIRHCMETTGAGRQFMEQHLNTALEHDYVKYPGKMDHTTCVAFKIGRYDPNEKEQNLTESLDPEIWPF